VSAQLRIGGVTIPANKHICIGLTEIKGIGRKSANKICAATGVTPSKKGFEVTPEEETALREAVSGYLIEGDLRRKEAQDRARLKGIQCYRALRHLKRLPCRGQRTRTNAQTASRV
jgi:small subunit ribosomal protein S13